MTNPFIARATVHAWSDEIGERLDLHHTSLQRLLKDQRRLTRFIERDQQHMGAGTGGVSIYMAGVIARMFEMAGGKLRGATWEQIEAAAAKVKGHVDALLPVDVGVVDRLHQISDRAQPHVLDEAAMVLFLAPRREGEADLDLKESFKILLQSWVVIEVLDANWTPPREFQGETSYTYVHIDPPTIPAPASDLPSA